MATQTAPVTTPEQVRDRDQLRHLFCECGLQASPWRARCGKTAQWAPKKPVWVGKTPDVCIVCADGWESKCERCGK